jgi:hypothetical protein
MLRLLRGLPSLGAHHRPSPCVQQWDWRTKSTPQLKAACRCRWVYLGQALAFGCRRWCRDPKVIAPFSTCCLTDGDAFLAAHCSLSRGRPTRAIQRATADHHGGTHTEKRTYLSTLGLCCESHIEISGVDDTGRGCGYCWCPSGCRYLLMRVVRKLAARAPATTARSFCGMTSMEL